MLSCLYPRRLHVCSGCCTGSLHALLVPVAGQTLRWPSHENCEQEGSDWPADRLPDHRVFFLYGWGCSASLLSLRTHTCRLGQRHNHTHAHSHTHKTHTDKGHILRDGGEMRRGSVCLKFRGHLKSSPASFLSFLTPFSAPLTSVCLLQACLSQRATLQLKDWRNLKKSSGSFIRQVASNPTFHWLV